MVPEIAGQEQGEAVTGLQARPAVYAPPLERRLGEGPRQPTLRPAEGVVPFAITPLGGTRPVTGLAAIILPVRVLVTGTAVLLSPCLCPTGVANTVPI